LAAAAPAGACPALAPEGSGAPILMALAHTQRPHYGVQFHPESVATRFGVQLLANFRDLVADYYGRPRGPPVESAAGPPGRCLPPQPWLEGQEEEEEEAVAAVGGVGGPVAEGMGRGHNAANSCWDDGSSVGGEARTAAAEAAAAAARLGPGGTGTRLALMWRRLEGALESAGGTQAIFSALAGPDGGRDTFWLDRWVMGREGVL
jgi:hypothetical protein